MALNERNGSLADHLGWATILAMGGVAGFALIVAYSSSPLATDEGAATTLFALGGAVNGPEDLVWSQFEEGVNNEDPDGVFLVDGRDGAKRYRIEMGSEFMINETRCRNFALTGLGHPASGTTHHVVCRSERGRLFLPWVYASGQN